MPHAPSPPAPLPRRGRDDDHAGIARESLHWSAEHHLDAAAWFVWRAACLSYRLSVRDHRFGAKVLRCVLANADLHEAMAAHPPIPLSEDQPALFGAAP